MKFAEPRPKLLSPERPPSGPRPNGVALTSADCASPGIANYNNNNTFSNAIYSMSSTQLVHVMTMQNVEKNIRKKYAKCMFYLFS